MASLTCNREFIPREFVEALVRICVLLSEDVVPRPTLTHAFENLMEGSVIPYGVQANTEAFRELMEEPEVGSSCHCWAGRRQKLTQSEPADAGRVA